MWNVICHLDGNNDNPERKIWNYSNTDVTATCVNDFLADVDWDDVLSCDNINNNWVTFKSTILDGQYKFLPLQPTINQEKH